MSTRQNSVYRRLTLLVFFAIFLLFNSSLAQHFVKMTDQQVAFGQEGFVKNPWKILEDY